MLFKNFLYGIILGIGFITPGVSGGVIATIIGIYDNIIYILNNPFKDIKYTLKYLTPLLFGLSLSVLFFSRIILFLFTFNKILISYTFVGLILGSIPYLFKEVNNHEHKSVLLFPLFLSFILGIILYIISNELLINNNSITPLKMIISGFFYAIGKIVPGISGSSLLIFLGVYEYLLNIIANPFKISLIDIYNLLPFIISLLISLVIIIKLMNYLIKNHYLISYSFIIGFILSSVLFIYPHYISILCIIISSLTFLISYNLSNK